MDRTTRACPVVCFLTHLIYISTCRPSPKPSQPPQNSCWRVGTKPTSFLPCVDSQAHLSVPVLQLLHRRTIAACPELSTTVLLLAHAHAHVLLPCFVLLLQPNVTEEANVGEIGCGGGRVTVEVRTRLWLSVGGVGVVRSGCGISCLGVWLRCWRWPLSGRCPEPT